MPKNKPISHLERHERRQRIAKDIKENSLSVAQASKKYKISPAWVRTICVTAGIVPKVQKLKYPLKNVALKILLAMLDGEQIVKLSQKYGITRQGIHQLRQNAETAGFIFSPYASEQRIK